MSDLLPDPPSAPNLRLAALVLAVTDTFAKRAKSTDSDARKVAAADYFLSGEHAAVLHPETGEQLGTVRRNAATVTTEVSNLAALTEWIGEQDGDPASPYRRGATYSTRRIVGDPEDVMAALEKHAPNLLSDPEAVATEWAVNQACAEAQDGQLRPGIEVVTKPGSLVVDVSDRGRETLRTLATSGRIDPFRKLPAAS